MENAQNQTKRTCLNLECFLEYLLNLQEISEFCDRISTMKATIPIISKGADSPRARDIPRIVPVNIPGKDNGSR